MKTLLAAAVPLALAGCSQTFEPPLAAPLTRAADPMTARAAPAGPAVAHNSRSIEAPGDWRQLNNAQAPGGSS